MDQSSSTCSTSHNYGGRRARRGSGLKLGKAVPGTSNKGRRQKDGNKKN